MRTKSFYDKHWVIINSIFLVLIELLFMILGLVDKCFQYTSHFIAYETGTFNTLLQISFSSIFITTSLMNLLGDKRSTILWMDENVFLLKGHNFYNFGFLSIAAYTTLFIETAAYLIAKDSGLKICLIIGNFFLGIVMIMLIFFRIISMSYMRKQHLRKLSDDYVKYFDNDKRDALGRLNYNTQIALKNESYEIFHENFEFYYCGLNRKDVSAEAFHVFLKKVLELDEKQVCSKILEFPKTREFYKALSYSVYSGKKDYTVQWGKDFNYGWSLATYLVDKHRKTNRDVSSSDESKSSEIIGKDVRQTCNYLIERFCTHLLEDYTQELKTGMLYKEDLIYWLGLRTPLYFNDLRSFIIYIMGTNLNYEFTNEFLIIEDYWDIDWEIPGILEKRYDSLFEYIYNQKTIMNLFKENLGKLVDMLLPDITYQKFYKQNNFLEEDGIYSVKCFYKNYLKALVKLFNSSVEEDTPKKTDSPTKGDISKRILNLLVMMNFAKEYLTILSTYDTKHDVISFVINSFRVIGYKETSTLKPVYNILQNPEKTTITFNQDSFEWFSNMEDVFGDIQDAEDYLTIKKKTLSEVGHLYEEINNYGLPNNKNQALYELLTHLLKDSFLYEKPIKHFDAMYDFLEFIDYDEEYICVLRDILADDIFQEKLYSKFVSLIRILFSPITHGDIYDSLAGVTLDKKVIKKIEKRYVLVSKIANENNKILELLDWAIKAERWYQIYISSDQENKLLIFILKIMRAPEKTLIDDYTESFNAYLRMMKLDPTILKFVLCQSELLSTSIIEALSSLVESTFEDLHSCVILDELKEFEDRCRAVFSWSNVLIEFISQTQNCPYINKINGLLIIIEELKEKYGEQLMN